MIDKNKLPNSVEGLIKFWKEANVEYLPPDEVKNDILAYLGWCGYLIGEVERLEEREFNHYPITIYELEMRIFKIRDALERVANRDFSEYKQWFDSRNGGTQAEYFLEILHQTRKEGETK